VSDRLTIRYCKTHDDAYVDSCSHFVGDCQVVTMVQASAPLYEVVNHCDKSPDGNHVWTLEAECDACKAEAVAVMRLEVDSE